MSAFKKKKIMKKFNLIAKLFAVFISANSFAQTTPGFEGIYVEKYYVANAADAGAAESSTPLLTTSSVTYRVYVDLATGYKLNLLFGNNVKPLTISSTAPFYNHPSFGTQVNGGVSTGNLAKNTNALDSYLTMGGVASGYHGVPKIHDATGVAFPTTNPSGILINNPGGCYGAPIQGASGKDGLAANVTQTVVNGYAPAAHSIASPTVLGAVVNSVDQLACLDQTSGGSIVLNASTGFSIAGLGGVKGSTTDNMVLIGQFTTTGEFSFVLNLQVQQDIDGGASYDYVAGTPGAGQYTHPTLTYVANSAPTVSVAASPASSGIITNTAMTFTATAADANGTVSGVEFFDNGVSIGAGQLATGNNTNGTYTKSYTASATGAHAITAKATDNDCVVTTSTPVNFTVAANQAPVISATTATSATFYAGEDVALSTNVVDNDGSVASVSFTVGGTSVTASNGGFGNVYTATYPISSSATPGAISYTVTATDNLGLAATSTSAQFTVQVNLAPAVSMTAPTSGAPLMAVGNPATFDMTLTATATDANGIATVQFFDNGTLLTTGTASNNGSTYTYVYTAQPGVHTYYAKATDNFTAFTNSGTVTVDIADPNSLNYLIENNTQNCNLPSYCMTVSAATSYPVANVIGYDVLLDYVPAKVTPTGNITLSNQLINPTFVESQVIVGNGTNGLPVGRMQVSLNLNGSAPMNTVFAGSNGANLFCVEFLKEAAFAPEETVDFTNLSVTESYYSSNSTKAGNDGSAISVKNQTYIANLEFWSDGQPIKYVQGTNLITTVKGSKTTEATGTTSSPIIAVTNATGVTAGMTVVANGVPVGTTVASVSGLNVTLSANPTAALSASANPPSQVTFVNAATPVTPNTSGVFTHSLLNGQDLRIERDIADLTSVQSMINSADAVLAKSLIANGNFTPSVYQIMALDVNLDGKVTSGDISQIKQRATLQIPEFRQAWNYNTAGESNGQPSKDWVFVDVTRLSTAPYQISTTFPAQTMVSGSAVGYSKTNVPVAPFNIAANVLNYATCPEVSTETYKGILLGDVNGSYATAANSVLLKSDNEAVVLDLASAVKEGNTFRIPVSFESTEATNAVDFAVRFNENNISFNELNNVAVGMEASSSMNEADRTFRFSGFDVANFTVGATVAELVVQSNNETISEKDIIADLALLNGKAVDVKFEKSSEAIQSVFNVSIYPNPSNGAFSVQATENAIVDVYDMNGKQIISSQVISSNGKVNIDLNNVEAGVYLVRVQNETFSTTKRIVIEK
jgi:hypothetical protein